MYEILLYKNQNSEDKIAEYISDLKNKAGTSKIHRTQLKKIIQYLDLLRAHGTMIGMPAVKHIEDDLWELRPATDRIFFFYWRDDTFVLLHHFRKQTQKTPPREIEQAKRNMKDFIERSKNHE